MPNTLRISEAASLAMHTMALLASRPQRLPTGQIASVLGASEAHLSKVMQRLAKAGLVRSLRGPKGGFALARPAERIALVEVYEAIEGPLADSKCLLGRPICGGTRCILGRLLGSVNRQVRQYLEATTLNKLAEVFKRT
jgi:Rrf2 family protein